MTVKTPSRLDPYQMWLGIKTPRRPPNPYEMLGLEPADYDAAVIEAAGLERRRTLQRFRSTAAPEVWHTMMRELEQAIEALLDPAAKATIDSELRADGVDVATAEASRPAAGAACVGCGAENPAHSKFCATCGQTLYRRCPQCEKECPLHVRFCGACGANLAGFDDQRIQKIHEQVQTASRLRGEFRFAEAIASLRAVEASGDPLLEAHVQKCLDLAAEIRDEWESWKAKAESRFQCADQLIREYRYDEVTAILDDVPAPLRSDELLRLARDAESKAREVQTLTSQIRTAIQNKQTTELLPALERLLTLKPGHEQARELSTQARMKLIQAAKKRLTAHQYDKALELMQLIPVAMQDDASQKLLETASEFSCLTHAIADAAVVDESLQALAERLCKLAPTNEAAQEVLNRIKKRRTELPADASLCAVDWAKPNGKPPLGSEVIWLASPTRFAQQCRVDASYFRQHPGQFFVAIGLALQGVGRSAMSINLLPKAKSGVLGGLAALRASKVKTAWGIDVGSVGLKAVKLSLDVKQNCLTLEAAELIPYDRPLGEIDGTTDTSISVKTALGELQSRHDLGDAVIATNLSDRRVLGRFFQIPDTKQKKLNDAILYEIKHQLPVVLEELNYDYESTMVRNGQAEAAHRVTLIAAKQWDVNNQMAAFRDQGIQVDVMQCDSIALHNFAAAELLCTEDDKTEGERRKTAETIVLANFGASSVSLVFSSTDHCWFRALPFGGHDITRALAKRFHLKLQDAEELKRSPARARRFHEYCDALDPEVLRLIGDMERSFSAFAKDHPKRRIARIYAFGGGVSLHGLLTRLRGGSAQIKSVE